jgi:hypothetical protein
MRTGSRCMVDHYFAVHTHMTTNMQQQGGGGGVAVSSFRSPHGRSNIICFVLDARDRTVTLEVQHQLAGWPPRPLKRQKFQLGLESRPVSGR